jgi:hypothetical protein
MESVSRNRGIVEDNRAMLVASPGHFCFQYEVPPAFFWQAGPVRHRRVKRHYSTLDRFFLSKLHMSIRFPMSLRN